jgi:sugar phosphate isomerase/epimerase
MKTTRKSFPLTGAFFWSHESQPPTHRELLEVFQNAGMGAAQVGEPFVDQLAESDSFRAQFLKDFAEAGVQIVGLAAYRNITSADSKKRRENVDYVKRALALAPELGTFAVATETGTFNKDSDWAPSTENRTPKAWAAFLESTEELLTAAEASGAILAYEGYVNNIMGTLDQVTSVFEEFPSRHLGLMLDPYNYITRDLLPVADLIAEEFFERFTDRFVIAHLKDVAPLGADGVADEVDVDRADLIGTPEFCTGVFPQQPYMRFLRDRRPDLPVIFEHLPTENLPAALRRLQALTGKLS